MLSQDEQLEIWWESLSPDQRDAVLEVDPDDDPPGWIVASLAAANVFLDESPATDPAVDIKARLPQLIQEFAAQKRGE
jgi:hypothetical protein